MPKIVFIGAGSVVFTKNLLTDIYLFPEFHEATVALHDIDRDRLETAGMMARYIKNRVGATGAIEQHLDRREALQNADYVINMVQVGMHAATLKDFAIPERFGLRQTIADTLGIGGIFRFLRTAPVLAAICHDMEEVAGDAVLLNYTNPMAMLVRLVSRISTVPVVGLCHSIQGTAAQLERYMGLEPGSLTYFAAGINHMAWYLRLSYRGDDAYPRLRAAMADPAIFAKDPVRFEMMRRLGFFVSESSEHMSEYVPYFIHFPAEIQRLQIPIAEYIRRSEENLRVYDAVKAQLARGDEFDLVSSTEYGAFILHSLMTGQPRVIYGNVPNRQLIDNLPGGCCVEVPCLVDHNGIQPIHAGALPPQLAAMNQTNINVQELAVEAFVTGKREHVYHAAMLDPNTLAHLSLEQIWQMVDALFDAHGEALPETLR